jgi:hypothetical protein
MFKHIVSSIGVIKISYCDYNREEYNKYIGQTLTKKEFYNIFPIFKPYKVINKNMQHCDYVYNVGLNKIDNFINKNDCYGGGFYVTDNSNIHKHLSFDGNIAQITLPDTSMIYLEEDEIKVSELIIEKIISKTEYFTHLNKQDEEIIKYIESPDKELEIQLQLQIKRDKRRRDVFEKFRQSMVDYCVNKDK